MVYGFIQRVAVWLYFLMRNKLLKVIWGCYEDLKGLELDPFDTISTQNAAFDYLGRIKPVLQAFRLHQIFEDC